MPGKGDNHILGSDILRQVRLGLAHYQEPVRNSGSSITVIRFAPTKGLSEKDIAKLEASRISATQKIKNFTGQGFGTNDVTLPYHVSAAQFQEEIHRANEDPRTLGIIVQMPPPIRLMSGIQEIAPSKDIDALLAEGSPHRACATADGITRVSLPFAKNGAEVAVIGAKGFVGSGVVRLLNDHGIEPIELDLGDDLKRARESDVIISAVGSPGIIGPEIIGRHHRAVVESGFVPQPDGTFQGDVHHDAYDLPQRITPVPRGIGPVEMAVLIERGVQADVDPNLRNWSYDGHTVTAGLRSDTSFTKPQSERLEVQGHRQGHRSSKQAAPEIRRSALSERMRELARQGAHTTKTNQGGEQSPLSKDHRGSEKDGPDLGP